MAEKRRKNRAFVVADAVGVAHFVVANFCILLGQVSDIFKGITGNPKYPGLEFVYRYFDAPVAALFGSLIRSQHSDSFFTFLVAELVIIVASIVFAVLAYFFVKLLFLLLE